ncbi:MAG: DNA adenine methylase [Phycisphaerales bacterium]
MIKYLGSKRTLLPLILRTIKALPQVTSVVDLFSGTSRVGHALKAAGYRVFSNDHNTYAATLARCYVQADRADHLADATKLIAEFNALPGEPGYFTRTFCEESRFFQPRNGARVDAIRERIANLALDPELEAILLVALMEAADRVDSTTGVQMAYLKNWAARAHNDLHLRLPDVLEQPRAGKCRAFELDAIDAARSLAADVVYVDPPYNQHSYLGNYHVWESLIRWDKPEVYGIACKRVDCRERRSLFNSRPNFHRAMTELLHAVESPYMILSFNNEGYISRQNMEQLLQRCYNGCAHVTVIESDYKRYVGAQIGIHNPQGKKVGKVSHLRNKEYLYIVARDASVGQLLLQSDHTPGAAF